ncbi:MAG TPA: class I SAM-dependent methyltransferase [Xanthobacteraceae bacterium]|nr:class I SAM-dependent methyltransferase [Xanthobacteraceae bacterium]
MKDWVAYYDSNHSIYVNARHRDVHYARLADAIVSYVPTRSAAVLDYGCGEAAHAGRVASAAGGLTLAEAGPAVRGRLIERFKGNPKIVVVSTERVANMLPQSFDMVILHSVSQYLTHQEFEHTAAMFHRLLQPNGLLVVGDVVPPRVSAVSDSWALLRFGWRDGFLGAAILGLIRTLFSDYRRLRTTVGLTRYSEQEMASKLAAAGFTVTREPGNLGHLTTRMTFLARKEPAALRPEYPPLPAC